MKVVNRLKAHGWFGDEKAQSSLKVRLYNTVVVSIEEAVTWWIPPAPENCARTEQCTFVFPHLSLYSLVN